jgi:tRNA threonylcarbamoyladenosine biosynthesis protein TsaB
LESSGITLAVDNSLDLLTLALAVDGELKEERRLRPVGHTSGVIGSAVSDMLAGHGYTVRDLALLAVTRGPGSFTGIRVALAFCKGVREGTGVPLVGLSTLEILAIPLSFLEGQHLCPVVDAKKGEVFAALFRAAGGVLTRLSPDRSMRPQDVALLVRTPCFCFGSGVPLCRSGLQNVRELSLIEAGYGAVSGEALVRQGIAVRAKKVGDDVRPIYGRRSEAELKFGVTAL